VCQPRLWGFLLRRDQEQQPPMVLDDRLRQPHAGSRVLRTSTARPIEAQNPHESEIRFMNKLREIASKRGLLFGAAVSYEHLAKKKFARLRKLLAEQCSVLVSENDMKWDALHPEENRYSFAAADEFVAFAKGHRQRVRGHALCWHKQNPAWLARRLGAATSKEATRLLTEHIHRVAARYCGRVHSWDVVNEAISGRAQDGLRNSPFRDAIGPKYVELAFRAAAEADPKALLTYNDYGLERNERKREKVLAMLRSLVTKNVPVHALGLQSHLNATNRSASWDGLNIFLDRIESLGLQVFITELDVDDYAIPGSESERDNRVAEVYRDYLKNVLSHRAVRAVFTWGIDDRHSWLQESKHRPPRLDGKPKRPLLFNGNLKPKAAFHATCAAIRDR
jgi:endo-1,4-beta-xylanase